MNLSVYNDGYLDLYDVVEGEDEYGTPCQKIKARENGRVWYREMDSYYRTRYAYGTEDSRVQMVVRIPRPPKGTSWGTVTDKNVCVIDGKQLKVFDAGIETTKYGVEELEIVLISPSAEYEVVK